MARSKNQIRLLWMQLVGWGITIIIAILGGAFALVTYIKQAQIDVLQERIQAKDDLLNEYRERLHLTSNNSTTFSTNSNKEIREKALKLVSNIRDYLEKVKNEEVQLQSLEDQEMRSAKTETERIQVWSKYIDISHQKSAEVQSYYTRNFLTDTILLRDEILTRLPKESRGNKKYDPFLYENPPNPLTMTSIANDLERIAKNLP